MREGIIARARIPGGEELTLSRSEGHHVVRAGGRELMSSRASRTEHRLAEIACAGLAADARVLIGGLGLGFTLRAALDRLGASTRVTVIELVPELVEWNRGEAGAHAGFPLEDARVEVRVGDVADVLRESEGSWDAILLDVDNGPSFLTVPGNARLYEGGVAELAAALRPGGVAAIWSAEPAPGLRDRMRAGGLRTMVYAVRVTGNAGAPAHMLYAGKRLR